jgi:hypothetical protein
LGKAVTLKFQVTQHIRDSAFIKSIITELGCGRIEYAESAIVYVVTRFSDITEKIIPFFDKYPILGVKNIDYMDFCKVVKNNGK